MVFSFRDGVSVCERRGECNLVKNVHVETTQVSQVSAFHWERCSYWMNSEAGLWAKRKKILRKYIDSRL